MSETPTPSCAHCRDPLDTPLRACAPCAAYFHEACAQELRQRCPSLACRSPLVGERGELVRSIRFSAGDLAWMVGLPVLVGLFFHRALPHGWKGLKVAAWAFPLPVSSGWAALRRIPNSLRRVAWSGSPRATRSLLLLVSPLLALALFAKGSVDGEAIVVAGVLTLWFSVVALALNLFQVAGTAELVRCPPCPEE